MVLGLSVDLGGCFWEGGLVDMGGSYVGSYPTAMKEIVVKMTHTISNYFLNSDGHCGPEAAHCRQHQQL